MYSIQLMNYEYILKETFYAKLSSKFYISFKILYFIQFCINATKFGVSNEYLMTPYMTMIKMLTSFISYSTGRIQKRGVLSKNIFPDFALEVSISIYNKEYL